MKNKNNVELVDALEYIADNSIVVCKYQSRDILRTLTEEDYHQAQILHERVTSKQIKTMNPVITSFFGCKTEDGIIALNDVPGFCNKYEMPTETKEAILTVHNINYNNISQHDNEYIYQLYNEYINNKDSKQKCL